MIDQGNWEIASVNSEQFQAPDGYYSFGLKVLLTINSCRGAG